jgi:pimeloyl-ACP methyl ester carboxylesterase
MPITPVHHRRVTVDGIDTFYREAGPADAPVVLLPHGYPASSFVYRNLMAALGHRWRLIAPDMPGFGRLALAKPERVAALIIQNGDIYHDAFGPKYGFLKDIWDNPGPDARRRIAQHVTLAGFESEFRGELPRDVADRISPDLWTLHWSVMNTPERLANLIRLLEDQPSTLDWFPKQQAYLREHQPPALIVWGPHDGYMPEKSAKAYHRDLPDAPIHLLGGGHWLLETHLDEVIPLVEEFLASVNED